MSKRPSRGKRLQTDPYIKAAAHPTRQTILKSLKVEDSLSTIELEKLTQENRYNLYHHLSKLIEADLIEYQLDDGRAKRYSLKAGGEALERFILLEQDDPESKKLIARILKLLAGSNDTTLPDASEVESVSVIFRLHKD